MKNRKIKITNFFLYNKNFHTFLAQNKILDSYHTGMKNYHKTNNIQLNHTREPDLWCMNDFCRIFLMLINRKI